LQHDRGRHRCPRYACADGYTLLELVAVAAIVSILGGVAVAQVVASLDRSRGYAAARYLGGRFALARMQAVARGAAVGFRFDQVSDDVSFSVFQDGNGNGIRTADIASGIDRAIEPATHLHEHFPGVEIGLAPGVPGTDPVQLGSTSLLTFTPLGTATSGAIYLRDREGTQWGVRVLGATGRARVLRYDVPTRGWIVAY
jgi:prepilin-type N-terminal cleavage/methylation domain-containing protein